VTKKNELRKRFLSQQTGTPPPRVWPNGRLNGDDDGELAVAIASDPAKKLIIMNFGMPVAWVGLSPDCTRNLIALLQDHLVKIEG